MTTSLTCCVLLPHFLAHVALQQGTATRAPLVVAGSVSDRATVVDVCPHAAQRGIRIGMSVLLARRRSHTLHVTSRDTDAAECAATRVEEVLAQHADTVRRAGMGCRVLPLCALGSDFSAAKFVATHLRQDVVERTGFPPRVANAWELQRSRRRG